MSIVVVPKRHVESVIDLTSEESGDLWRTSVEVHRRLDAAGLKDLSYLLNEGSSLSGKTVPHVHMLLMTYQEDDGIVRIKRTKTQEVSENHLIRIKQILR